MQRRRRSNFWAQGAQLGVVIFLGNLVNRNAGASVEWRTGKVGGIFEGVSQLILNHGQSGQLLSFPLRPL